jgi:hypothetical protein
MRDSRDGSRLRLPRIALLMRATMLDCFVAEFIIGPAKGRTRWLLAMT